MVTVCPAILAKDSDSHLARGVTPRASVQVSQGSLFGPFARTFVNPLYRQQRLYQRPVRIRQSAHLGRQLIVRPEVLVVLPLHVGQVFADGLQSQLCGGGHRTPAFHRGLMRSSSPMGGSSEARCSSQYRCLRGNALESKCVAGRSQFLTPVSVSNGTLHL